MYKQMDQALFSLLFSQRVLELTILPTEQCNFRCSYCYEDFRPSHMSPAVVDAIKLLIASRAKELDNLRIGWFGGEPLLAGDVVLDISRYAHGLSVGGHPFQFDAGMSTNAYLLSRQTASQLIGCGVRHFQVTLDGPAEYHDSLRRTRNGRGTFARIWENLLAMQQLDVDFQVNLRIHFSKHNQQQVGELIDMVNREFSGDERFRVMFKAVMPLGGSHDAALGCLSDEESEQLSGELLGSLAPGIAPICCSDEPYICYAGRPTAFVIRYDGRIVKCTVGLDEDLNQVGQLLGDGQMRINQAKIRPWLRGAVGLDREFLRCPRAHLEA